VKLPAHRAGFPVRKEPNMIAHPDPAYKAGFAGRAPGQGRGVPGGTVCARLNLHL